MSRVQTAPAETVFAFVGKAHRLFLGLKFNHAGNRPEDFFLRNTHLVVDVGEQRGLHKGAGRAGTLAAADYLRPLFFAEFDVVDDLLKVTFVNLRTDLRGHIRGIAHLHLLKGFGKCRDELVINPFLHEDAGTPRSRPGPG